MSGTLEGFLYKNIYLDPMSIYYKVSGESALNIHLTNTNTKRTFSTHLMEATRYRIHARAIYVLLHTY